MYFRLKDELTIRKYLKKYGYAYWGCGGLTEVTKEQMDVLRLCDGVTEISEEVYEANKDLFDKYLKEGKIDKIDAPRPLLKGRGYREFNHRRRFLSIWAITTHCNIECIHCLYGLLHDIPDVPMEDAQKIIDHLADYGIEKIGIFGGEPMFHPHFWEILNMIEESGMQIGEVDTNGMFLTEKNLRRLKEYRSKISLAISFDGLGTHDWMRNFEGCEQITLDAIKRACDMGFDVLASINVNKKTTPRMDETIDCMVSLGVKRIRLLATSKTPKWMETTAKDGNLVLSMEEYGEFVVQTVEKHIGQIRNNGVRLSLFTQLGINPWSTRESLFYKQEKGPEKYSAWCSLGCDGIFISTQGGALLCKGEEFISHFNGLDAEQYNIVNHTLDEVFDTDLFKEIRYYTRADIKACSEECRNCDQWEYCLGGSCRGCAVRMQGFDFNKANLCSPDMVSCVMYRGGYMERIAEILDKNPLRGN